MSTDCKDGRCPETRDGQIHNHIIHESAEKFDDFVVSIFNERISQEYGSISSTEVKASIIIAACIAMLAILLLSDSAINLTDYFQKSTINRLIVILVVLSFTCSFFLALLVVFPRGRMKMIDPLEVNNQLSSKSIKDVKYEIKSSLIKNFKHIEKHRIRDTIYLKCGYILLAIGCSAMVIGMLFI